MLSPLAARKAEKLGYKNVRVYHAGIPAWKKDGHIVVSNVAGLEHLNKTEASYILIDVRSADTIRNGHIPSAVSLPTGGIEALKSQFPKYKAASIILYNDGGDLKSAEAVYKKITSWGYKQVSVLTGGFKAWEKAGQKVAEGAAADKISYVRKLLPGEVELDVFTALLKKPAADSMILDVRLPSEVATGQLPGTKSIPLDELEQRLSELPKDKKIIIHCVTGTRAEMAYTILKKNGFDAKYVRAKVDFDKDNKDKYTISD